ncbi:MAG: alginate O-acetyltransferase AlgX-related protein [Aggregatilineales bacterium]
MGSDGQQYRSTDKPLLRDAPNAFLAERVPSGAHYLDLTPGFRAALDPATLYYPFDRHFTPAGHALAAQLIAEHIETSDLLRP